MGIGDAMREKLGGSNRRIGDAMLDEITGLLPTMTALEHEVHKGNVWAFSHRLPAVAADGFIYVQIDTGVEPVSLHLVKFWSDTAIAELDLRRAPDAITPGTTAIPIFRLNHTIATPEPDGLQLFSDPSAISGGTLCQCNYMGGGNALGVGSNAAADQRGMPLIMSPETTYVISAKNIDINPRAFAIQGFFSVEQD